MATVFKKEKVNMFDNTLLTGFVRHLAYQYLYNRRLGQLNKLSRV